MSTCCTRNYASSIGTCGVLNLIRYTFEEQYTQIETIVDEVAERVGTLGGIALGTLEEFKEHSRLKEAPGENPKAMDMVREAVGDQEQLIKRLRNDANIAAERFDDLGTEPWGLLGPEYCVLRTEY